MVSDGKYASLLLNNGSLNVKTHFQDFARLKLKLGRFIIEDFSLLAFEFEETEKKKES